MVTTAGVSSRRILTSPSSSLITLWFLWTLSTLFTFQPSPGQSPAALSSAAATVQQRRPPSAREATRKAVSARAVRVAGSKFIAQRTRSTVIGGQDAALTTAAPVMLSVIGEPRAEPPAPTCRNDWHQTRGMAAQQVPLLVAVCLPGPAW